MYKTYICTAILLPLPTLPRPRYLLLGDVWKRLDFLSYLDSYLFMVPIVPRCLVRPRDKTNTLYCSFTPLLHSSHPKKLPKTLQAKDKTTEIIFISFKFSKKLFELIFKKRQRLVSVQMRGYFKNTAAKHVLVAHLSVGLLFFS